MSDRTLTTGEGNTALADAIELLEMEVEREKLRSIDKRRAQALLDELAECGRLREQLVLTEKQRRIFEELSKLNASERADKAEAECGRLREELKTTRKNLKRATYIAKHLWQMIDQETWRSTGGDDGQGHYEGDYHAEQIRIEIQKLSGEMNLREQEA